jgi:hypothetical protein
MTTEADPIVGIWYMRPDNGLKFQVVAVDEGESVIEIQYFDGDIEELDLDDWYQMELEQIESPEDISGALDVSELDDLGSSITDTEPGDWDSQAQELKGYNEQDFSEDGAEPDYPVELASYEEPWDDI